MRFAQCGCWGREEEATGAGGGGWGGGGVRVGGCRGYLLGEDCSEGGREGAALSSLVWGPGAPPQVMEAPTRRV